MLAPFDDDKLPCRCQDRKAGIGQFMWSILFSILCPFLLAFFENAKAPATPVFLVSNTQKVLIFQRVQGIVTTVYCFDVTPKWNSFEIKCTARYRGFESHRLRHVGASCISLAPTFFKSQSALISLLLLSDRDSLRWIRGQFLADGKTKLSGWKPPDSFSL